MRLAEIKIATGHDVDGTPVQSNAVSIPAYVKGGLALHPAVRGEAGSWVITHVRSGRLIANLWTREAAEGAMNDLLGAADWDFGDFSDKYTKAARPEAWSEDEFLRVKALMADLRKGPLSVTGAPELRTAALAGDL